MRYIVTFCLLFILTGCLEPVYKQVRFTRDESERAIWKAFALKGDMEAQYKLGTLYCCGEKPYHHNGEALRWFCAAARQGQKDALLEAAKLYADEYNISGSVVPTDKVQAYSFYRLAEERGSFAAINYREHLEFTLSNEQRAQAEVLIKQWPEGNCEIK